MDRVTEISRKTRISHRSTATPAKSPTIRSGHGKNLDSVVFYRFFKVEGGNSLIGLLQRVSHASVTVEDRIIAEIGNGLLVFVAVETGDSEAQATRLLERILAYRIFADGKGRINLDVRSVGGSVLLVPQFTLAADTRKGNRPGFSSAAAPEPGRKLFEFLVRLGAGAPVPVAAGRFGATMRVDLSNEGPMTFWLQVPPSG